ncbi:MAG: T9SS type A sorting domain-containing protein, partial [Cytophagales bacterium]
ISDDLIDQISLFPNPAKNLIRLNLPTLLSESKISVIGQYGNEVLSLEKVGSESSIEIPIETLNKGIYFLKIENTDFSKTLKFIRN